MSLLANISDWLQKSGSLTRNLLNSPLKSEWKADRTPVTEIDQTVEHFLRESIIQHYPEDGIIGEEFPAHQPDATRQWIIDPIDGTRALIGGFPTFTTLIAMMENDRAIVSGMLQPITNECWVAEHQAQTLYNKKAVSCDQNVEHLSDACFATTSTLLVSEQDKPKIEHFMREAKLYQLGADGYAYGKLTCGTVDLIVESGMQPYDFMPLIPIITGAGGIITDWQGKELTLRSNGQVIAASSKALHQQAMALLNEA